MDWNKVTRTDAWKESSPEEKAYDAEQAYLRSLSAPDAAKYSRNKNLAAMNARERKAEEEEANRRFLEEQSKFPWDKFNKVLKTTDETSFQLALNELETVLKQRMPDKQAFDVKNVDGKTPLELAYDFADDLEEELGLGTDKVGSTYRERLVNLLKEATRSGGQRRKSRLNVKRRRTQRNRRGRVHRKLRKLATRRR
jgi:hypothetical protein